jgi:DNA-binding CsgD family transcriptional regulator
MRKGSPNDFAGGAVSDETTDDDSIDEGGIEVNALAEEIEQLGGDVSAALADVPVPGILLDRNGIMRWQNKASLVCRGNHLGAPFVDYVAPGDQPDARAIVGRMLAQGEPAEFRLHVLNAKGVYVPLEFSAVPIHGGGGVVGIFGLTRPSKRPRRVHERAGYDLTKRQRQVLGLLADGRSTLEISRELRLSQTTVRNYVAGILAALGVHTRLQAVVVATSEGLLDA